MFKELPILGFCSDHGANTKYPLYIDEIYLSCKGYIIGKFNWNKIGVSDIYPEMVEKVYNQFGLEIMQETVVDECINDYGAFTITIAFQKITIDRNGKPLFVSAW